MQNGNKLWRVCVTLPNGEKRNGRWRFAPPQVEQVEQVEQFTQILNANPGATLSLEMKIPAVGNAKQRRRQRRLLSPPIEELVKQL